MNMPKTEKREESPFVGRDNERSVLKQALDMASSPNPKGTVVFLEGVAGIGKTALVNDFARSLPDGVFHCKFELPERENVPTEDSFHVIKRFFDSAYSEDMKRLGRMEFWREVLGDVGNVLSALPFLSDPIKGLIETVDVQLAREIAAAKDDRSIPMEATTDNQARRDQAIKMLRMLLDREEFQPTVLTVDNFDSIDRESAGILLSFVKSFGSDPLLLLLTYRPDELAGNPWLRDFVKFDIPTEASMGGMGVENLPIDYFSQDEMRLFVSSRYGEMAEPDERLLAALRDKTGGNPLFVEETLAQLRAEDGLVDPVRAIDLLDRILPARSELIIDYRIQHFRDKAAADCKLHERMSIIGPTFTDELGAALANCDVIDFIQRIEEASKIYRFIVLDEASTSFRFRHSLIYKCFRRRMTADKWATKKLHRLAAEELERLASRGSPTGGQHARIAVHYIEAGSPGLAVPHLEAATDAAVRDHAYHELVERASHLLKAMEASGEGSPQQKFDATLRLGRAYELLGRKDEAVRTLEGAVQLAETTLDDPLRLAASLTHFGAALFHSGKHAQSAREAHRALDLYTPMIDSLSRDQALDYGKCLDWIGENLRNNHRLDAALEMHEKARDVGRQYSDSRLEAHAIANTGAVYMWKKEYEEVPGLWSEALRLSSDPGKEDWPWLAHYAIDVGLALLLLRDYKESRKMIGRGLEVAEERSYYDNIARGRMNMANLEFAQAIEAQTPSERVSLLKLARDLYEQALPYAETHHVARLIWRIKHNLGNVCQACGDIEGAEARFRNAIEYIEAMRADEPDKEGFMKHRLGPYRSLMMLLWNTRGGREDATRKEISQIASQALNARAVEFGQRLVLGEFNPLEEGERDKNFFGEYLVETE